MRFLNITFSSCNLDEASFLEIKCKKLFLEDCSLNQIELMKMPLKGLDITSCQFDYLKVDMKGLNGLIVNMEQALILSSLLGIKIKN